MEQKPRKVNLVTLGCWKNTVDSEVLAAQLKGPCTQLVEDAAEADTVVINTCGFVEAAQRESVDAILEAVERKSRGEIQKIVVMGCLSERFGRELASEIPEVDAVFGSNNVEEVVRELGCDFKRELLGERLLFTPSHYAYLKISEGCDHPCSFCAIPLMRGKHRSKPHDGLLAEARLLAERGVKELILIAQDSTYYGLDLYGERRLGRLLADLGSVDGVEWLRLMYAFPSRFPMEVLEVFRQTPKLCRYLDLPVQHAADGVLKSMRRGTSGRSLRELIETIRREVPGIALRTTLIVGYPTETESDFEDLCAFVREMRFHRLGVFTYSHEEGTAAYALGDPIPREVKEERRARILEIQQEIVEERNRAMVGEEVKVLIDRLEGEYAVGRTQWDAPEIDQEVLVANDGSIQPGNFWDVTVVETTEYDLVARKR